jgi:TonB family protein
VFETLLASNLAVRPQVRPGLIALLVHMAIVLGAVGATASSRAIFQPVPRDTIRLDLTRLRMLEREPATAPAPPSATPEIPAPPPVTAAPPQVPALEPLRLGGSPLDLRAVIGMRPDSGPDHPAGDSESAPAVVSATDVDVLPQLAGPLQPRYPEALRRSGVSGEVLLEYVVGSGGRVDSFSVRILRSTHPAFSAAALEALSSVHFRPGRRLGRPVAVLGTANGSI